MPGAERSIVVKADPARCYAVITDFEAYPSFNPETKKIKILSRDKDRWRAEFTVNIIKDISYVIDLVGVPGKSLTWTQVSGWFKKNDGGWTLKDNGDGTTHVTYRIDLGLGPLVPKSVIDPLLATSFPAMLERFKQRMESKG